MEDENQQIAPQPMTSSEIEQATPEQPMFNMETLMGNFMDMPQQRRKVATRLLSSPALTLIDEILGEPTLQRLADQLGRGIPSEVPQTNEQPAGMMAPSDTPATTTVAESEPTRSDRDNRGDDSTMMI